MTERSSGKPRKGKSKSSKPDSDKSESDKPHDDDEMSDEAELSTEVESDELDSDEIDSDELDSDELDIEEIDSDEIDSDEIDEPISADDDVDAPGEASNAEDEADDEIALPEPASPTAAPPRRKRKTPAAAADTAVPIGELPAPDRGDRIDDEELEPVGATPARAPRAAMSTDNRRDRTLMGFIGMTTLVGLVLRLVALGDRALHHDESLDAWWSWNYLNGDYQGYDPVYHGPLRFYITGAFYWLFGETVAVSRLFSALAGAALIWLAWYLRDHIGRVGAAALAVFLCVSPSLLYYSRFGREDAQIVFLTGLMLVLTIAYFRSPRAWQPTAILLALSASLAIKESTYLLIFIVATFVLMALSMQFAWLAAAATDDDADMSNDGLDSGLRPSRLEIALPVAALLAMIVTVVLADATGGAFVLFGLYGFALFVLAVIFGLRANAVGARLSDAPIVAKVSAVGLAPWLIAIGLFAFSFVAFFTVWFTRPGDWHTGFTEAIDYWQSQQDVNRGSQPWYYYLVLLPAYEWAFIALAVLGSVVAIRRRTFALGLVAWLAAASLIVFSYAGERMPWLAVHPMLPILILAAVGAASLWQHRRLAANSVAIAAFAAAIVFTTYSSLRLSFVNGHDGREMLVQGAQATEHVPLVVDRVEELTQISQSQLGRTPVLAVTSLNSWPWGFYFRDRSPQWFDPGTGLPENADIIITDIDGFNPVWAEQYDATLFSMRSWWVPEWNFADGEEAKVGGYDASVGSWAQWQIDRTVWTPDGCGSVDQYLLIKRDLADAAFTAGELGVVQPDWASSIELLPCVSSSLRLTE